MRKAASRDRLRLEEEPFSVAGMKALTLLQEGRAACLRDTLSEVNERITLLTLGKRNEERPNREVLESAIWDFGQIVLRE